MCCCTDPNCFSHRAGSGAVTLCVIIGMLGISSLKLRLTRGGGSCPRETPAKLFPPWLKSWSEMPSVVREEGSSGEPSCVHAQGGGGRFTVCLAALVAGDVYWVCKRLFLG